MANPQHFTLVANTAKTFTLDQDYARIEVVNVDGAGEVYFTVDGSAPAVGGDGCHVLPASICSVELDPRTSGPTVVKAKASVAVRISVRGL